MPNPKVSIIIPTYNRADMLVQAIQSVFSQTYQDFEIIVSDDGSIDHTRDVLQSFGEKVIYLENPHCGLPSKVRNAAIDVARGEFIAFLDSDDLWMPDKLAKQIALLDEVPKVGLVSSNAYVIDKRGKRLSPLYLQTGKGRSGSVFLDLLKNNFVITSSAMVRREVLEQVGQFPEAKELIAREDYALWLHIALDWDVYYFDEPLISYRDVSSESLRGKQDIPAHLHGMISTIESIMPSLLDIDTRQAITHQVAEYRKILIVHFWIERRFWASIREWLEWMAAQPAVAFDWLVFENTMDVIRRNLNAGKTRW